MTTGSRGDCGSARNLKRTRTYTTPRCFPSPLAEASRRSSPPRRARNIRRVLVKPEQKEARSMRVAVSSSPRSCYSRVSVLRCCYRRPARRFWQCPRSRRTASSCTETRVLILGFRLAQISLLLLMYALSFRAAQFVHCSIIWHLASGLKQARDAIERGGTARMFTSAARLSALANSAAACRGRGPRGRCGDDKQLKPDADLRADEWSLRVVVELNGSSGRSASNL